MRTRFRGRRLSPSRSGRRPLRKYRWVAVSPEPFILPVATASVIPLLSPIIPPGTVADGIYQSMTTPTIIAVQGQVTLLISDPPGPGSFCNYAWGLYVDEDAVTLASSNTPFSTAGWTGWMMWHVGTLFDQSLGTNPATDLAYRRYEFTQRKYRRKADSGNDSLLFVVENAAGAFSSTDIQVHSYFRILLLE